MILKINNIEKTLGKFHLGPIDLKVEDSLVLLGPTGSGKTSLFEIIAGFVKPDDGRILIDDKDVTKISPEHRNVGIVYQDFQLFPHLNVKNNIGFGLKLRNLDDNIIDEKVKEIANKFDITHLLKNNVRSLSGGEKQKVALARALIVEPSILLMDEPFSSVDEEGRGKIREEFKKIKKNFNCLIIFVTHNQEEAFELAEDVAIIYEGKILAHGDKMEVFNKPKDLRIAQFLGFKNIFTQKDLQSLGININSSYDFYALPGNKLYVDGEITSNQTHKFKAKLEKYEKLRDKTHIVLNINGIIFERDLSKNFTLNSSSIHVKIDPKDFLHLK